MTSVYPLKNSEDLSYVYPVISGTGCIPITLVVLRTFLKDGEATAV